MAPDAYPRLEFPDEAWQRFVAACESLGIPDSAGKRVVLERIYSHLLGVNSWFNLTRITDPWEYLKLHVLDSLTALEAVSGLTQPGDLCIDFGSGGGYPGLPLAVWLPDRRWRLIDSRKRKVLFLNAALTLTPCSDAAAVAVRGSEVAVHAPELLHSASLVVARAVGRVDSLLPELVSLPAMNGFLILMKGPAFEDGEAQALNRLAPQFGLEVVQESRVALTDDDPERILVLLAKTDERQPGSRRRTGHARDRRRNR